jgi:hypothetical protein
VLVGEHVGLSLTSQWLGLDLVGCYRPQHILRKVSNPEGQETRHDVQDLPHYGYIASSDNVCNLRSRQGHLLNAQLVLAQYTLLIRTSLHNDNK